jgi:hypothetical protein
MPPAGWPAPTRRRRRFAFLAAGIVVAFAVVAGVAWPGRHATPPLPGSTGRGHPGTRAPSPGASSRPAPGQLPRTDLAALEWTGFYGVELPVSPSAGPRYMRRGLARGFADSPLGALLAAVNIGVRANAQWGPGIFGPTIRGQVTGPGAAALLAACRSSYARDSLATGVPDGKPLGRVNVTEEAFRWVAYTPADATVDIVSAGPGGDGSTVRAVTRIEVTWSGRDWLVIAPPGGDWGNSAAPLTSITGYTRFPNPAL